jgi:NADH-quinone oxidoreductase subunit L
MYHAIVFLPLIGFLIAGLFGRSIGAKASEYVTSGFLVIAAVLSWIAFISIAFSEEPAFTVDVMRWIQTGALDISWAFRIDTLTAVMLVVVNTVSALVHIYSIGYMHHDPDRPRFFAYLSLFTFAMLMLVTSDNLVQMFFGWEGVGLASYLLIGFWYKKPSANAAAMKAFIVNRVGDFGFALGIFGVFVLFGSVNFSTIFANAASFLPADAAHGATEAATEAAHGAMDGETVLTFLGYQLDKAHAITIVCLLLFMGAMGKSAQFLLHTWLPDAMEGPTPVSALIHAATMVTAGVFMVARMSPLFELSHDRADRGDVDRRDHRLLRRTVGLVQNDIKRVIAYSTCSQLGYMFVALGVGAYGAGIFHLFTHAFFKALLFLGAGSVIHAISTSRTCARWAGCGSRSRRPTG